MPRNPFPSRLRPQEICCKSKRRSRNERNLYGRRHRSLSDWQIEVIQRRNISWQIVTPMGLVLSNQNKTLTVHTLSLSLQRNMDILMRLIERVHAAKMAGDVVANL